MTKYKYIVLDIYFLASDHVQAVLFDIRNIVIVIVVVFVIVIIVVVTRPGILTRWAKFRAWLFKLSGQLEDMYILCRHLVMPGQSVISFFVLW